MTRTVTVQDVIPPVITNPVNLTPVAPATNAAPLFLWINHDVQVCDDAPLPMIRLFGKLSVSLIPLTKLPQLLVKVNTSGTDSLTYQVCLPKALVTIISSSITHPDTVSTPVVALVIALIATIKLSFHSINKSAMPVSIILPLVAPKGIVMVPVNV